MSADNGIYILETPIGFEKEYRVAHCQAIENICYGNDNGNPMWVVRLFGNSKVFHEKRDALLEADNQAENAPILEYGISTIRLPFAFYDYENRIPKR